MSDEILELVSVMNQIPVNAEARADSPLHHADFVTLAKHSVKLAGIVLQEKALLSHLVLRGDAGNADFVAGVEKAIGLPLPSTLCFNRNDDTCINWISPDEWLIIAPVDQGLLLEQALRSNLAGHFAVVNVSGGQTLLDLSGENVRDMLMKSTVYDVHDSAFPIGKVITSIFAKSQVILKRTGEHSWQMVVRRSFSDYVWLWLQDSCAEFGLQVRS